MSDKLTRTKRILFVIAIMMSNCAIMGDSPLYTISNELYNAWPEQQAVVNYALSGPPLLLMIASLCAPFILKHISKKKLLVIGSAFFTVGSVCSVTIPTAVWFACMRTLVGIGQGFVQVTGIALMTEVFYEENIRNKYMGYYNAANGAVGIFYNYFAGHWAVTSYVNAFNIYYASIPMLIMAILFIPELEEKKKNTEVKVEDRASTGHKSKEVMGVKFWSFCVILLLYYTINMVLAYFRSVFIAEQGLGNSVLAGYMSIAGQISSIIVCAFFGPLMKKLKKWAMPSGVGILFIVYCLYTFASSIPVLIFCQAIQMVSFSMIYTYHMSMVPFFVPESRRTEAITSVSVLFGLGSFLPTYLATFLMNMFDGTFSSTLMVYVIAMAVLTVVSIVIVGKQEKNM